MYDACSSSSFLRIKCQNKMLFEIYSPNQERNFFPWEILFCSVIYRTYWHFYHRAYSEELQKSFLVPFADMSD